MPLQHLRSSTANKRPTPASMSDGQLAINTNLASPGLFFKDSNGALVKVGPVHVGTTAPNASPAVGGQAGNSVGEQWLDTSSSRYVFKVWDGTAWRSESGEFVDAAGDVMTGALGIIAGSAGAPGLYFSGDTNTGVFSAGADTLAISTGGVAALQILNDGGLFVGRPTGDARVEIGGGATGNRTAYIDLIGDTTNADYGLRIQRGETGVNATSLIANKGSGSVVLRTEGAGPLIFDTNNAERLRIDSSGRVGIGTSSPNTETALDVNGVIRARSVSSDPINSAANIYALNGVGGTLSSLLWRFVTNANDVSAGTERMRIDSSGRVGIGTASPSALLHTSQSSGFNIFQQDSGSVGNYLYADSTGFGWVGTRTNHPFVFGTNNTERLRIDSSGNVGIGTSVPATPLQVGNSAGSGAEAINKGTIQINAGPTGLTQDGGLEFKTSIFGSGYGWRIAGAANGSTNPLLIGVRSNSTTWTTRVAIEDTGNIGVGTTAPGAQLHLYEATAASFRLQQASCTFNSYVASGDYTCGTITNHPFVFTTNNAERVRITAGGSVGIGTSVPEAPLHVNGTIYTKTATNPTIGIWNTTSTFSTFLIQESAEFKVYTGAGQPITFANNGNERLRIDSSGNVGIGTSSPGAKLDVVGETLARGNVSTGFYPFIARNENSANNTTKSTGYLFQGVDTVGTTKNTALILCSPAEGNYVGSHLAFQTRSGDALYERLRIDSSGRVLVGTSASVTTPIGQPPLQVTTGQSIIRYSSNGTFPASIDLCKSKTDTVGTNTILGGGDQIGWLTFAAADGSSYVQAARIAAEVDGTPGANDMPGRLVFSTTADGASSPTERLRIDSSGNASFAGTGALKLHAGTTAERPGAPTTGMVRYNSSITQFEGYNGSAWGTIGGGAKGAGSDQVFFENDQTVTTSYTITAGKNAMSAGPVTIGSGVTVTVPSGSVWVVV